MSAAAVTFDAATHTYTVSGVRVPSVTQVLAPLSDLAGIPASVLNAKRDLGHAVHMACELDDADNLDEATVHAAVQPYLRAYRAFRQDTRAVVLACEQRVYHPVHRYAGTLDRVFRIDGHKVLTDLKTCFTTPASVGPQTAAYQAAHGNAEVKRRAALQLRPDGTYRFQPLDNPNDMAVFVACLTVHRFKEQSRV